MAPRDLSGDRKCSGRPENRTFATFLGDPSPGWLPSISLLMLCAHTSVMVRNLKLCKDLSRLRCTPKDRDEVNRREVCECDG